MLGTPDAALPFAKQARARLGAALYRYVLGRPRELAADAPDANEAAFARLRLVPRVLRGAGGIDIASTLCGHPIGGPLAVGPFAGDRMFHEEGLLPVARVCRRLALPLMISEETVTPLAAITALHTECWLQVRAAGPLDRARRLADAAAACGARGLVLTVLAPAHPTPGRQPGGYDIGAELARRGWTTIGSDRPGIARLPAWPQWGWGDVTALAAHLHALGLALILKGVLDAEDAAAAADCGCAGVIVSNIGLRQSDRWALPLQALPEIRAAHAGSTLMDGGVRDGVDALIACCLGADIGVVTRPVITTLAGGGEQALLALLTGWLDEIAAVASWLGVARLAELDRSYLQAERVW